MHSNERTLLFVQANLFQKVVLINIYHSFFTMKKLILLAIVAFGAGTMLSSCCCNDANAPKLPNQPKFQELPNAPVMPVKVSYSKK